MVWFSKRKYTSKSKRGGTSRKTGTARFTRLQPKLPEWKT
jgi:hypothetical protein